MPSMPLVLIAAASDAVMPPIAQVGYALRRASRDASAKPIGAACPGLLAVARTGLSPR